jgi:serine/threonine protein kinase
MKTRWRAVGRLTDADPRRVDGFALQGRLGQGGMGVVYLGEHAQLGPAAIKFVHAAIAADPTFRARFRREVEAADRVASVRVARVLGADVDAQVPWLATAFVDGPTLSEAVGDGNPMAGDRLLALAAALADALTAIHRAGVVHRDLKPSNILLTPSTPVVIDFGIAAAHEQTELTRTGMQLGTPGWMAPEQVRGRRAGPATDVFAWGMVVAYAASGRPPFGRGPADALYYRVVHQRPHLPEGLPAPLDALVPAALVKDPRQRPSVADLVTGLEAGVWPLRPDTSDNGADAGTDAPTT